MSHFNNIGLLPLSDLGTTAVSLIFEAIRLGRAQIYLNEEWAPLTGDVISLASVYRVAEKTLEIPWSLIHRDFGFATVDDVDNVFVHAAYPTYLKGRWNSAGDLQVLDYPLIFDLVGVDPETSLIHRPEDV